MRLRRFFVGCSVLIHDSSTMTPLPPARPASAVPVSPAAPRRIGGRGARGEGRSSSAYIASGVGSDPTPHIRHGKHLLFPTPPAAAMHRGAGAIPGRDPGRVPHHPQLPTYTPQSDLIHTPGIDYQPMPHAVPSSTITSTSTHVPANAPPSFRTSPAGDFLFTNRTCFADGATLMPTTSPPPGWPPPPYMCAAPSGATPYALVMPQDSQTTLPAPSPSTPLPAPPPRLPTGPSEPDISLADARVDAADSNTSTPYSLPFDLKSITLEADRQEKRRDASELSLIHI